MSSSSPGRAGSGTAAGGSARYSPAARPSACSSRARADLDVARGADHPLARLLGLHLGAQHVEPRRGARCEPLPGDPQVILGGCKILGGDVGLPLRRQQEAERALGAEGNQLPRPQPRRTRSCRGIPGLSHQGRDPAAGVHELLQGGGGDPGVVLRERDRREAGNLADGDLAHVAKAGIQLHLGPALRARPIESGPGPALATFGRGQRRVAPQRDADRLRQGQRNLGGGRRARRGGEQGREDGHPDHPGASSRSLLSRWPGRRTARLASNIPECRHRYQAARRPGASPCRGRVLRSFARTAQIG